MAFISISISRNSLDVGKLESLLIVFEYAFKLALLQHCLCDCIWLEKNTSARNGL